MALLAEFTGPRWRTQAIAAAVIGVPIGGMIGAVIAAYVLPHFGWRAMFVIGGLLPVLHWPQFISCCVLLIRRHMAPVT